MPPVRKNEKDSEREAAQNSTKRAWLPWAILGLCILILAGSCLYLAGCFRPRTIEELVSNCKRRPGAYTANLRFGYAAVGDRMAEYHEIKEVHSKDLTGWTGEPYADGIYLPKGSENLKYLISRQSDGSMILWAFSHFVVTESGEIPQREFIAVSGARLPPPADCSPYTYADAAKVFYGLDGPEEIVSIAVLPSQRDNTPEGKAVQEEIGAHTITDRDAAAAFYGILTRAVCLGHSIERGYYDLPDRFTYSFSGKDADGQGNTSDRSRYEVQMRAERYLTVHCSNGTTIDAWKYDAIKGCFYENGGVCTEPLSEEDVCALNAIFGIE